MSNLLDNFDEKVKEKEENLQKNIKKIFYLYSLLSYLLSIISIILLIIQSFRVITYYNNNKGKILGEKILLERMGYEIYSSFNKTIIPKYNITKKCEELYKADYFGIKLETFFDCRDINDESLDFYNCQNQITSNYTCCLPECCISLNPTSGEKNTNKCNFLDFYSIFRSNSSLLESEENDYFFSKYIINDPRNKNCKYYNKYSSNFSVIFGKYLCKPPLYPGSDKEINDIEFTYEKLLEHSVTNDSIKNREDLSNICENGFKPCGILDTMGNILCLKKEYGCPISDIKFGKKNEENLINKGYTETNLTDELSIYQYNETNIDKDIFIFNLFSEIPPISHEWDNEFPLDPERDKNYDENMKTFSIKNIEFLDNIYDKYYKKVEIFKEWSNNEDISILLEDIFNWNLFDKNYSLDPYKNKTNQFQRVKWYHKNFIGFKSIKNILKIRKLFDNNIYYMSKINRRISPGYFSFVIGIVYAIIFMICFIDLIFNFIKYKNITEFKTIIILIKMIINVCLFISYFILFSINYWYKYKRIDIKSDDLVKEVIEYYLSRRKLSFLLISIIIWPINCALDFYFALPDFYGYKTFEKLELLAIKIGLAKQKDS